MNAPMRSLTVSPLVPAPPHLLLPPLLLPPQVTHWLTGSQSVLHLCLDVRRGGHSCLYERTVDVGIVLYTIWAILLTNCCVLFTGYAWSHVMCSAGAISALLFPLVCALCLHSESFLLVFFTIFSVITCTWTHPPTQTSNNVAHTRLRSLIRWCLDVQYDDDDDIGQRWFFFYNGKSS